MGIILTPPPPPPTYIDIKDLPLISKLIAVITEEANQQGAEGLGVLRLKVWGIRVVQVEDVGFRMKYVGIHFMETGHNLQGPAMSVQRSTSFQRMHHASLLSISKYALKLYSKWARKIRNKDNELLIQEQIFSSYCSFIRQSIPV